jgi:hypothetical protein
MAKIEYFGPPTMHAVGWTVGRVVTAIVVTPTAQQSADECAIELVFDDGSSLTMATDWIAVEVPHGNAAA